MTHYWFLPLVPGFLLGAGAVLYCNYRVFGLTPEQREACCDICPDYPYGLAGLVLFLAGVIPSIVLFIGGGADRDGPVDRDGEQP